MFDFPAEVCALLIIFCAPARTLTLCIYHDEGGLGDTAGLCVRAEYLYTGP